MSDPERYVYEDHLGNRAISAKRAVARRRAYRPGDKVGSWEVLEYAGVSARNRFNPMYLCRCVCGAEQLIQTGNLRMGRTTQCKACYDLAQCGPRRTDPYICRWCGVDYTTAQRRKKTGGPAAECPTCNRRATPGRNGRAPCGYPLRKKGCRPAGDHACEECAE
jgi:hypothetical protein